MVRYNFDIITNYSLNSSDVRIRVLYVRVIPERFDSFFNVYQVIGRIDSLISLTKICVCISRVFIVGASVLLPNISWDNSFRKGFHLSGTIHSPPAKRNHPMVQYTTNFEYVKFSKYHHSWSLWQNIRQARHVNYYTTPYRPFSTLPLIQKLI